MLLKQNDWCKVCICKNATFEDNAFNIRQLVRDAFISAVSRDYNISLYPIINIEAVKTINNNSTVNSTYVIRLVFENNNAIISVPQYHVRLLLDEQTNRLTLFTAVQCLVEDKSYTDPLLYARNSSNYIVETKSRYNIYDFEIFANKMIELGYNIVEVNECNPNMPPYVSSFITLDKVIGDNVSLCYLWRSANGLSYISGIGDKVSNYPLTDSTLSIVEEDMRDAMWNYSKNCQLGRDRSKYVQTVQPISFNRFHISNLL